MYFLKTRLQPITKNEHWKPEEMLGVIYTHLSWHGQQWTPKEITATQQVKSKKQDPSVFTRIQGSLFFKLRLVDNLSGYQVRKL